ncbi:amino acid ABC transporter permease [Desulfosediminicola ganghwensis]|uniref:amino acid ABC transporter permease n=1 Tax=Desulfosediminicola ganghwensis TaxID=2569540 RepID=UPI0010AC1F9B|nr:amino acid ABC transporter permease [Desulfosediminicola ganghwensis]
MNIFDTFFNIPVLIDSFPMLLRGLGITIALGAVSIVLGLVAGLVLALVRIYGPRILRLIACGYIDVFRSIPILVLLVLIYYALPFVGIRLSAFTASVVTLSLVSSAYTAEIFRSGIEAIPRGQIEASQALGYRFIPSLVDIILPQALKIVIPPLTSNCINVVKDTALASVVAMPDLLKQATQAQALAANPSPLIGAALMYLILLLPLVHLVSRLESYLNTGKKR